MPKIKDISVQSDHQTMPLDKYCDWLGSSVLAEIRKQQEDDDVMSQPILPLIYGVCEYIWSNPDLEIDPDFYYSVQGILFEAFTNPLERMEAERNPYLKKLIRSLQNIQPYRLNTMYIESQGNPAIKLQIGMALIAERVANLSNLIIGNLLERLAEKPEVQQKFQEAKDLLIQQNQAQIRHDPAADINVCANEILPNVFQLSAYVDPTGQTKRNDAATFIIAELSESLDTDAKQIFDALQTIDGYVITIGDSTNALRNNDVEEAKIKIEIIKNNLIPMLQKECISFNMSYKEREQYLPNSYIPQDSFFITNTIFKTCINSIEKALEMFHKHKSRPGHS